jgi:hypothetical protein
MDHRQLRDGNENKKRLAFSEFGSENGTKTVKNQNADGWCMQMKQFHHNDIPTATNMPGHRDWREFMWNHAEARSKNAEVGWKHRAWGHQLDAEASSWRRNDVSIFAATPCGTTDADCHE